MEMVLVVERVAANSFEDFYRLGATCKSLKELTKRPGDYAYFDVFTLPWNIHKQVYDLLLLLQTCYANGNPSTLYIKSTQFFFNFNLQEEGLVLIKKSADAGFERTLYNYTMIHKVFWDDEEYFSRFTRKSIKRIGKLVRFHGGWSMSHNAAFLTKKDEFMSNVIHVLYDCQCTPYEDQCWNPWYVENSKRKNMCNRCFWIRELGLFYRDFEPEIAIPDTRLW